VPSAPRTDPSIREPVTTPGEQSISVTTLQGWHLPLLDDPAFLPLQPLLQRSLLLAVPRKLVRAFSHRPHPAPLVLVATQPDGSGRSRAVGLIVTRTVNRSGSCWEVQHLRLALAAAEAPQGLEGSTADHGPAADGPPCRAAAAVLLREAIQRTRGAASWIATAASLDTARLATLREQGFQPQRTDRLWRWQARATGPLPALPANLLLRPLQRRNAPLLWHLEQATCPAPLRQVLDRRVEDLLDRSGGHGWLLIDADRNEAVAAARWVADHPAGGHQVELSVHPGWLHLLGSPTELLLRRLAPAGDQIWLHSEVADGARQAWLTQLGAEEHGDVVLMARSVWRRQEGQPSLGAARRLGAVLEQLQPRRRPVPTPVGQR